MGKPETYQLPVTGGLVASITVTRPLKPRDLDILREWLDLFEPVLVVDPGEEPKHLNPGRPPSDSENVTSTGKTAPPGVTSDRSGSAYDAGGES